jgi:uncharacterized membrane protein YccC
VSLAGARVDRDPGPIAAFSVALGLSALASYWFVAHVANPINQVTATGDTIGALWAAISTVFVFRHSLDESSSAALSRVSGTLVSFVLCEIYLLLFTFHLWSIAVLVALGAFILAMAGRDQDTMPASLATLVVLVIVGLDPHHAAQQPLMRLFDTAIGVAIGLAAVWGAGRGIELATRPRQLKAQVLPRPPDRS